MKPVDRKIIHKSLDGEATKEETKILKRKLESDPEIRRQYEELKSIEETTVIMPPIQVPADFTKKVLGKIKDAPPESRTT
ncbi:MAG: hypothetical protein HYY17_17335 [Planctomycetes bacterium]|nr:hypothetical protein [Planctomycetota bacterium]